MVSSETLVHGKEFYDSTDPICISGLKDSLNPRTRVFDKQLMNAKWRHTYEFYPTEDLTSTAICLIGVTRSQLNPAGIGLDIEETLGKLFELMAKRSYLGGYGLVLWANAVCDGDLAKLENVSGVPLSDAVDNVASMTTMETAWLLSGISHQFSRFKDPAMEKFLVTVLNEITQKRYQQKTQLVAHSGIGSNLFHGVRRWIANFADQVYSIQALAFAALVSGDKSALNIANSLASKMIQLQGKRGQWWWHYDAKRGGSPQPYSVYSVHQHGMAPMALYALANAANSDFDEAITKSRSWLCNNELGVNIIDQSQPTIWRSLDYKHGKIANAYIKSKSLLGLAGDCSSKPTPVLKLNQETRPYEWAWCLYAGAIERNYNPGFHLV